MLLSFGPRVVAGLFLCLLLTSNSFGAGFALYEWSARSLGMGGTMVAKADDPSAIAFNPAGITQLEGINTMVGITAITPSTEVEVTRDGSTTTTDTEDFTGYPPHAYYTHQLNDTYWVGVGLYTRFGLATEYPDDWAGRYSAYFASVESYSLNPNLAIKLTDNLSLALGFEVMNFTFKQKKQADGSGIGAGDVDTTLEADSTGFGGNIALHYAFSDQLKFGVAYKTEMRHKLEGEASYTPSSIVAGPFTFFPDTDAEGTLDLPDSLSFGVAYIPNDQWSFEADFILTGWSSYDELKVTLDDPPNPTDPSTAVSQSTKNWKDVWRFQLGAEYAVTDAIDLRAGYVYDESPINDDFLDYLLPSNDRQLFSFGAGYKQDSWSIDGAYTYLMAKDRSGSVDVSGDPDDTTHDIEFTDNTAHIVSVSFSYSF